jgi:hypothetical protein
MNNVTYTGIFVAVAFVAGAFIASPELRAHAANTVGSADIINNSILSADIKDGEVKTVDLGGSAVTSAKIKDGEVKAAEIATDAVGASEIAANAVGKAEIGTDQIDGDEIAGITQLIFAECFATNLNLSIPGTGPIVNCNVPGADEGENVIAAVNVDSCLGVQSAVVVASGRVEIRALNNCGVTSTLGADAKFSIIVFDI